MSASAPLTIFDCASLSANVYTPGSSTGAPQGWETVPKLSGGDGTKGFYGCGYKRGKDLVVAFRGTSDANDMAHNARMIPTGVTPERAKAVLRSLINSWEKTITPSAGNNMIAGVGEFAFSRAGTEPAIKAYAKRVPVAQSSPARTLAVAAYGYAHQEGLKLRCFVGHSLGGAIAQWAGEQTGPGGEIPIPGVPGVSFNGPYMGDLDGTRFGKGGGVLICNTYLDPLSRVTNLVGNSCHASSGCKFDIVISDFGKPPPAGGETQKSPSDPYLRLYKDWFVGAAVHYHSIVVLADHLSKNFPGKEKIATFFR
jgi:hypothetical protein